MMPRLAAEEELLARATASHPHLDARTQTKTVSKLARAAGLEEPVRKPSRADLAGLGLRDVTREA